MSEKRNEIKRNIKKVIIHPKPNHRDDVFAYGLICAFEGDIPLEIKNPTEDELNDPAVACVDVGKRYEPGLNNFDHHQMPKGTIECALSLVAKAYGVHELLSLNPWYKFTCELDSCGPIQSAKSLGLEKLPEELFSPLEDYVIKSINNGSKNTNMLVAVVQNFMKSVLEESNKLSDNIEFFKNESIIFNMVGIDFVFSQTKELSGFKKAMNDLNYKPAAHILYDNRGNGMNFFRIDDHPKINFSVLENDSRFTFAHKNGFTARSKYIMGLDEVKEVLLKCLVQ